jgi:hypothetical protein
VGRHIPVSQAGWNADRCACGAAKDRRSSACRSCYSALPKTKQCTGCGISKKVDDFYFRRSAGRPLPQCKCCTNSRPKPDYSPITRSRPGHYKRVASRLMQRRRTDPIFKLADNLRRNLRQCLHRHSGKKASPTLTLLDCSVAEFRAFIEAQWRPGMTWANWGRQRDCWQLDHIRPVASFDLNDPEQLRACFHYSNYQPLWTSENAAKGARH